jgi:UDP-glucose 4-epimerase
MEQMSKWLITGGCGFIGRNLIKYLKEQDIEIQIRVIDNFSVGNLEDLNYATQDYTLVDSTNAKWQVNKVEVINGDILDEDLAFQVSSGADCIVHLAANTGVGPSVIYPRMDCKINVMGTLNYLEACRINKIKRFVFASSIALRS